MQTAVETENWNPETGNLKPGLNPTGEQRLQACVTVNISSRVHTFMSLQADHGSGAPFAVPLALCLAAAIALGLSAALFHFLERRFVFTDYIHSDK